MIGLLPENAYVVDGEILFRNKNILEKSKEEMRVLRAKEFAIVFQDPMTFLNPVLTIGAQLEEVFLIDKDILREAALLEESQKGEVSFSDILSRGRVSKEKIINVKLSRSKTKRLVKKLCVDLLRLVLFKLRYFT